MLPLDSIALSDTELRSIIDYLKGFPQPTTGEALFADYCAGCHGADGTGGPSTVDLTMLANSAVEVPMQVRMGSHLDNFAQRTEYEPFRAPTELSDSDLMLLTAYIDTL